MTCTDCRKWYFILDTVGLCDDCLYRRARRDERLSEREVTLNIASLAGWALTGQAPHRYRRAWGTW